MPNTSSQAIANRRVDFPFPLFLYAVIFLLSGLLNTFQSVSIFYGGLISWIQIPAVLWGLINSYLLGFIYNWVGILVTVSGILNVISAVMVFGRMKYCRRVAQVNLVFGFIVCIIGYYIYQFVYGGGLLYAFYSPGFLGLILYVAANGGWYYYFEKYELLP